ncbi:TetR/AcrR family transcriptional regulator [Nocardia sp. CC227C]|uniref:TetR/AcrR family transcriptional regulator n=1 Tax=Nocardia sp. CC227C TaxID=3044562 RepID=UPI00278C25F7|nr:TetR/AcrR family transcriptional regulator [Nocardia sp. CC227C]
MTKRREGGHRLGSKRDSAVDTAVLDATRRLLVERGYGATSIDAIAKLAEVGRPTIYRRWPSKAHIVNDTIYPTVGPEMEPAATFAEDIARLVAGAVTVFADPATREAAPGLMNEVRTDASLHDALITGQLASIREELARRVEAARERGEARPDVDADILIDVIAGAAIFALSVRDVEDTAALTSGLTSLLLRGVLADPAADGTR